jgi:hypothetical protein
MLGLKGLWRQLHLRRPFSRQLNLSTSAVLREPERAAFIEWLGEVRPAFALEVVLRLLAAVYAGRFAEADRLLHHMAKSASTYRYSRLFHSTDLRKFMLACFRDYLGTHPRLPDEAAFLLYRFSRLFDEASAALVPEAQESHKTAQAPPTPLRFEKVARITRAPVIKIIGKKFYYGPD